MGYDVKKNGLWENSMQTTDWVVDHQQYIISKARRFGFSIRNNIQTLRNLYSATNTLSEHLTEFPSMEREAEYTYTWDLVGTQN